MQEVEIWIHSDTAVQRDQLEHPAPEPEEGRPEAHLEGPEPVAVPDEHEWRPPDHDEPSVDVR